ncbi:MAG: YbaK/EbsC family protein [Proteobacteria bacterium]|nr:YbaK/EbsC family protein [Pseudomonadota bacterium]
MSQIPKNVADFLAAQGLEALEFEPGSTPTAETAAGRIGVPVGQIAKSMLFKGKDGKYRLVLAAGDRRIDSSLLKKAAGCKHRMATHEETFAVTGFRPGGVCPFGLTGSGVEILLDVSLDEYETIYPAAGTDATGVPMSPARLVEVTGGVRVRVAKTQ